MRILVANGVNLDLLGRREPELYGTGTLKDLEKEIKANLAPLKKKMNLQKLEVQFFQSNVESELFEFLDQDWSGVVLNPGAWGHTSLALADRLKGLDIAFVEVHISQILARETFRHHSYTAAHAIGVISGFGFLGYHLALEALVSTLAKNQD
jgi:3-dehydroquinate dehydratase II